jgi:hypothetical protein
MARRFVSMFLQSTFSELLDYFKAIIKCKEEHILRQTDYRSVQHAAEIYARQLSLHTVIAAFKRKF